ncbi:hypothetical protein [Clostridium butyricum]|uniref:hypothetical protein n=2 Tax=Clostridiaceae TaxID=31979 RepID=UPI000AFEB8D0
MKFALADESMYELITQNEADRIKDILKGTGLKENINIEVLDVKYKINCKRWNTYRIENNKTSNLITLLKHIKLEVYLHDGICSTA